mgnify:FL=1|jgi:hypothetical protein|tara:strand:+ start:193 stop:510 length:318 start_codon:yes stop_codon:yes gene_type:complete
MIKPKITKPWSKEMYEWNDIVAGLMKGKIRESIEKNKDNWDILNELIVLCGGIKYGDGFSIEDLYEGCLDELDSVMNYWLNEEFPYAVSKGWVEDIETDMNFIGY